MTAKYTRPPARKNNLTSNFLLFCFVFNGLFAKLNAGNDFSLLFEGLKLNVTRDDRFAPPRLKGGFLRGTVW